MYKQTEPQENFTAGIIPSAPWRVVDVKTIGDHKIQVKFIDGMVGVVDLSQLVNSKNAGVFADLKNFEIFNRVFLEYGVVTWPGELDLAPDAMHAEIKKNGEWILK